MMGWVFPSSGLQTTLQTDASAHADFAGAAHCDLSQSGPGLCRANPQKRPLLQRPLGAREAPVWRRSCSRPLQSPPTSTKFARGSTDEGRLGALGLARREPGSGRDHCWAEEPSELRSEREHKSQPEPAGRRFSRVDLLSPTHLQPDGLQLSRAFGHSATGPRVCHEHA